MWTLKSRVPPDVPTPEVDFSIDPYQHYTNRAIFRN
jgi:hypothetical protein